MSTIFDLKQSASELPSLNQGTAKLIYEQHPPTRDVTGSNFPNGSIHIRWQVAGTRWWIPSRSYIRMRATIRSVNTAANAAIQPSMSSDVSPNMALMANLFQSLEFRIADKTVSRTSDYVAQVDALEKRIMKSKSWLDSAGNDLEWLSKSQIERASEISSDGLSAETVQTRFHPGVQLSTVAIASGTGNVTGAVGTLFNTELRVGDILEVTDDAKDSFQFVVDAVTTNTAAHVHPRPNADIGATASWVRKRVVGNNPSLQKNSFEMVWQPPLSIFKVGHAMPAGKYELVMNPQNVNSYQKRAVESLVNDLRQTQSVVANNILKDFEFVVDNMYLYLATVEGPRVDDITYYMSLEQTRCQAENINSGPSSLQQKNFDVSPSTYALSLAFQDTSASGDNTLFSGAKFKIRAKGTFADGATSLTRMYIQYAGQNKPSPDADPNFEGAVNYLKQRYADSIIYNGGYFDCGGPESYDDWLDRGIYFYFSWPKDGANESTRVNVNYQLSENMNDNGSVLLFDHHKKMVIISLRGGRVVDVLEQDA